MNRAKATSSLSVVWWLFSVWLRETTLGVTFAYHKGRLPHVMRMGTTVHGPIITWWWWWENPDRFQPNLIAASALRLREPF